MKALLFVAAAMLLATSAVVSTARADQPIPAPQSYAPPPNVQSYAPPAAYAPPPQQAPSLAMWNDSTVPAKIGSPKQP